MDDEVVAQGEGGKSSPLDPPRDPPHAPEWGW
jgi:hypothetical protein